MVRALGMDHQPGIGTAGHDLAGAACVVQMHMGGDDVVDGLRREPERGDHGEYPGYRPPGARFHARQAISRANQITGGQAGTVEAGLDAIDAGGDFFIVGLVHRRGIRCAQNPKTENHESRESTRMAPLPTRRRRWVGGAGIATGLSPLRQPAIGQAHQPW